MLPRNSSGGPTPSLELVTGTDKSAWEETAPFPRCLGSDATPKVGTDLPRERKAFFLRASPHAGNNEPQSYRMTKAGLDPGGHGQRLPTPTEPEGRALLKKPRHTPKGSSQTKPEHAPQTPTYRNTRKAEDTLHTSRGRKIPGPGCATGHQSSFVSDTVRGKERKTDGKT